MPASYRHQKKRHRAAKDDESDTESTIELDDAGEPKSVNVQGNNVYFYCDVTTATVLDLQMTMARIIPDLKGRGVQEVNLYIQSTGGDAFAGLAGYDALKSVDIWLNTIVTGCTCSAATILAMAGDTRAITAHAQMLIHQVTITFAGSSANLRDEYGNTELLTTQMVDIYTTNSNCSEAQIRRIMEDESVTTPAQALELGLVTEIW
jgi:ATP-dependent protease ClpP protease subunit